MSRIVWCHVCNFPSRHLFIWRQVVTGFALTSPPLIFLRVSRRNLYPLLKPLKPSKELRSQVVKVGKKTFLIWFSILEAAVDFLDSEFLCQTRESIILLSHAAVYLLSFPNPEVSSIRYSFASFWAERSSEDFWESWLYLFEGFHFWFDGRKMV